MCQEWLSWAGTGTWFQQTYLVSTQKTQMPGSKPPRGQQLVFQELPR